VVLLVWATEGALVMAAMIIASSGDGGWGEWWNVVVGGSGRRAVDVGVAFVMGRKGKR
jgi:hypothetical protein